MGVSIPLIKCIWHLEIVVKKCKRFLINPLLNAAIIKCPLGHFRKPYRFYCIRTGSCDQFNKGTKAAFRRAHPYALNWNYSLCGVHVAVFIIMCLHGCPHTQTLCSPVLCPCRHWGYIYKVKLEQKGIHRVNSMLMFGCVDMTMWKREH